MAVDQQLFARELKQWMVPVESKGGRQATADTIGADALAAVRAILIEIEEASVYIAITASIASALHKGRAPALTFKHLTGYLPSSPDVYRRHIETALGAALSPHVILSLQAYHARLSYALRLTHAIVDAGPAPSQTIRTAEFETLEDSWRHVCGTALAAISVTRELLASVRYSRPPVNNEHAEALLRSAKAGGQPCITGEGQMRMPPWAESRLHARKVTRVEAFVLLEDGATPVVIDNASRTGIGLSCISGLPPGMALTIALDTGTRLQGKVMWARGERAGVRLDVMLPADHPLLGGAHNNPGRSR